MRHHALAVDTEGTPVKVARAFARAARQRLAQLPPFDLVHLHEWMTGRVPGRGAPTVLSLGSVEAVRRNGAPAGELSREIDEAEREAARGADCVLTPDWLREKAIAELGLDAGRVRAFPMEGRVPDEWECPLDVGVHSGIGVSAVGKQSSSIIFRCRPSHGSGRSGGSERQARA